MAAGHTSVDVGEDGEGFIHAECSCGFKVEGLPDDETAIDVLMDHAYEMGRLIGLDTGGGS